MKPWTQPYVDPLREDKFGIELTSDDIYYMIRNSEKMPMEACRLLENDLERVTVARFPIIKEIKKSLVDAGAMGALMSGSGPSVFGVFESEAMAIRAKADS
jgi:4-diphosphocytidyl-2-C-methyl-D-erythritol kinase